MKIRRITTDNNISPDKIGECFDRIGLEWTSVDVANWEAQYPYKPKVAVRIAHTGSEILLHYRVEEDDLRAVCDTDNGRSWEDSCVEFFLQPDAAKPLYYNFEFTCVGYKLVGGGEYGTERGRATLDLHSKVRTWSSLGHTAFGQRRGHSAWQLAAVIPAEALYLSQTNDFSGKHMRGNFYKCGDLQPRPHFLSWTQIQSEKPQFHLPQFFGDLDFE